MRIGIDLTWLKPSENGGIEVFARYVLEGFSKYSHNDTFVLFLALNNYDTFSEYDNSPNFERICLPIDSRDVKRRIIYQNIHFGKIVRNSNISVFFTPVYAMPLLFPSKVPCVTTVHDLQAVHYPQYFSRYRKEWLAFNWKTLKYRAHKIVAISDFVKEDIQKRYNVPDSKITRIYNPVIMRDDYVDFSLLESKYNIRQHEYYYTVVSMLPHKNLVTLLRAMQKVKVEHPSDLCQKLVVSGVNGISRKDIESFIKENHLEGNIILTGYIPDNERNTLIKNTRAFLFPSVFEGFGVPPIEAMMLGTSVITTKCASLYEITEGKATYVDNPYDVDEWIAKLSDINYSKSQKFIFPNYSLEKSSTAYLKLLHEVGEEFEKGK